MSKLLTVVSSGLFLTTCLAVSAKADIMENLVFTGMATCETPECSSFGSGPLTGTYTLDVTSQTIVGAWSFSTPLGVISSSETGAAAFVSSEPSYYEPEFEVYTTSPAYFQAIFLSFTGSDELGTLDLSADPGYVPTLCQNGGTFCYNDYALTGSNSVSSAVPEPSSVILLVTAVAMVGFMMRRRNRAASC